MISKTTVEKLIDEVRADYNRCWTTLIRLKEQLDCVTANDLVEFQPTLARALFRLDETHRILSQERSRLIARKSFLSPEWSRRRFKALARYQKAIVEVIKIGRALGDSFAWLFYRNDRSSLEIHFRNPLDLHTPPGIGGEGELEFVRNVKFVQGLMVLYHGITTFLRIGDISLIDLKEQKVIALGDLKSMRSATDAVDVKLFFTGPDLEKNLPENLRRGSSFNKVPMKPLPDDPLPSEMMANLLKQFKRMEKPFEIPNADHKVEYHDETQVDALRRLAEQLVRSGGAYEKAGDGLLLVGIKNPRAASLSSGFFLSTRAAARFKTHLGKLFPDLVQQTRSVFDMSQPKTQMNANSIFIGHLSPSVMLGTIPLFWWNLPSEFLRQIFFREVVVQTIYNPAHLIARLRQGGYEVKLSGRNHSVSKQLDNGRVELIGFDHFQHLINNHLMHEDVIVALLSDILIRIESGKVQPNSKITLRVEQR